MMKSFRRRSSSFTKREVEAVTSANELSTQTRPQATPQEERFVKRRTGESVPPPVEDNRLKCKFEAIDVLLQILLHQDELTLKEYTINDSRIKVLVIEDTEF